MKILRALLVVTLMLSARFTIAQDGPNVFSMKQTIGSHLIHLVIVCNPSPMDRKRCESDSVFINVDGGAAIKAEVSDIEITKLSDVISAKGNSVLAGATLTEFCTAAKKEYDEHFKAIWKSQVDFSQAVKFNFSIYSDLYGLSSSQPNGLIQPSFFVSFPISRRSISLFNTNIRFQLFRNIVPQITISKLDDHLRDLPTLKADTSRDSGILRSRANIFDILQYSFLNFSAKLNFINISSPRHSFYLDFIATNFITSIYDSLHSQTVTVPSYSLGWNTRYATHFAGKFNFEFLWSRQFLQVITNDIQVTYGPQFKDIAVLKEAIAAKQIVAAPHQSAWYSSFGGQISVMDPDGKSYKFLKCTYFVNSIQTYRNSFFQIQLGYSANLDDFLKSLQKK